jgi:hypothetical protein
VIAAVGVDRYDPVMLQRLRFAMILLLCAGGCAATHTYDVTVVNKTKSPVVVWLYKDGPPFEEGWMTPEQFATVNPATVTAVPGVVLAPGKTGNTGPLKGKFDSGVRGWLRIYSGTPNLEQMLATSAGSSLRLDVPLSPGKTSLIITTKDGHLAAQPAESK